MKSFWRLCFTSILLVILTAGLLFLSHSVHAQLEGSPVQQVSQHGIIMQFNYYPQSPTINNYTVLSFNVLNSTTNKPLQNFVASVTVGNVVGFTGGSGYYNFSRINVTGGNFSVKYTFPNDGLFPIILRVDSPASNYSSSSPIAITEFKVIVPVPTPISNDTITIIYVGIGITAAGVGAGIVIMQKRKSKVDR
jgi:hypothetical protein